MPKKTKANFETQLDELTELVNKMESGELTLEESLENFEKGIHLTRQCQKLLDDAEARVADLLKSEEDKE